ncbi:MAG: hypothetical protein WCC48_17520 [Anaeromyxobacteraceae bacterium]
MTTVRATLPAILLLAACSTNAPQQYAVPDVRILAIRDQVQGTALPPYADADEGQTVDLEALVANPLLRAPVTVDWYYCPPWREWLPVPSCLDPLKLADPAALTAQPDVFQLGGGAVPAAVSSVSAVTFSLSAIGPQLSTAFDRLLTAARAQPSRRCQLFVDLPIVAIARAPGVTEVAVKRLRLTPTARLALPQNADLAGYYVPNRNPVIGTMIMNPADADACTGGTPLTNPLPPREVTLCSSATMERFNQCQADGTYLQVWENAEWQWYASAGEIVNARFNGNATAVSAKLEPVTGPFTLWQILRDGNGGADWQVHDLAGP